MLYDGSGSVLMVSQWLRTQYFVPYFVPPSLHVLPSQTPSPHNCSRIQCYISKHAGENSRSKIKTYFFSWSHYSNPTTPSSTWRTPAVISYCQTLTFVSQLTLSSTSINLSLTRFASEHRCSTCRRRNKQVQMNLTPKNHNIRCKWIPLKIRAPRRPPLVQDTR